MGQKALRQGGANSHCKSEIPKLQTTVRGFLCVPAIRCTWTTVRITVNGHVWAHRGSNRLGDRRMGQTKVDAMPACSLCPGGCRPGIIDHYLSLLGWSAIARCRGGIFFQQGGDLRPDFLQLL